MKQRTNVAVWYEKHKRWQIKVQKDGVRKTFYSSTPGRTGQRVCHKKADMWLDEGIGGGNKRISYYCKSFVDNIRDTESHSAYILTEKMIRLYIEPAIGHLKPHILTEQHLQIIINDAFRTKNLSKKYLQNMRYIIGRFLKFLRKCKASNLFLEDLTIPKKAKTTEKTILQPDDIGKLFATSHTQKRKASVFDICIYAYRFAVITGLRPGEILGLQWRDIKKGTIRLKRSVNVYGETTQGKNQNAKRSFALNSLSQEILTEQAAMLEGKGIESEYVFPDESGERLTQSGYYKRWVRYREYNGITPVSPYELRHTFVSIVKTLPEGLLKQLVGHSKDMDTYGIYSHEIKGDKELASTMVEDIFKDILDKT